MSICLVGVGSVGKNLLDAFHKNKIKEEITVIDGDIIHKHNYQYKNKDTGKPKVDVCKEQYRNIKTINEFVEFNNIKENIKKIFDKSTHVFDCTDTFVNRVKFDATKIYINKDKLIVDFQKKIKFNHQIEGNYISYINETHIKSLIGKFANIFVNKPNQITEYKKEGKAIYINNLGDIQPLYPIRTMVSDDIETFFQKKCGDDINHIKVDIFDGPYCICNDTFSLKENSLHDILEKIDLEISHLPAVYMTSYIKKNDVLSLALMSQTGGA